MTTKNTYSQTSSITAVNPALFFEQFGGFWIDQEPELHEKMKAIEEKHKCKVYAVTHEYTEFGELYDFLIVTDYELFFFFYCCT